LRWIRQLVDGVVVIPKLIKPTTPDDVASLVGAVAIAIFAVIIVTALYVGREIFVPVALAILLSFVLASPVGLLQRIGVPRAIAVAGSSCSPSPSSSRWAV
jgi:predicted PurR-regulated permease PerM